MVIPKGYFKTVRNRHVCGRLPRILDVEENNNKRLFETIGGTLLVVQLV
jgi:hypothetical protein